MEKNSFILTPLAGTLSIRSYVKTANDQGKILYVNEKQGGFDATVQFGSDQSGPALDQSVSQFNEYVKRWKAPTVPVREVD